MSKTEKEKPKEEQEKILMDYLRQPGFKQAFEAIRGEAEDLETHTFIELAMNFEGPNAQYRKKYDPIYKAIPVIGTLLKRLKEKGLNHAALILSEAIVRDNFFLPWEEELMANVPVTIIAFNPKQTIPISEWLKDKDSKHSVNGALDQHQKGEYENRKTKFFFDSVKTFKVPQTTREWSNYLACPLGHFIDEFRECLTKPFLESLKKMPGKLKKTIVEVNHTMSVSIAYVCTASKKEVLGCFTREEQKNLGIWSIEVPEYYLEGNGSAFNFRLEFNKRKLKERKDVFWSPEKSAGYYAILNGVDTQLWNKGMRMCDNWIQNGSIE